MNDPDIKNLRERVKRSGLNDLLMSPMAMLKLLDRLEASERQLEDLTAACADPCRDEDRSLWRSMIDEALSHDLCRCGHERYQHSRRLVGYCAMAGCPCVMFYQRAASEASETKESSHDY